MYHRRIIMHFASTKPRNLGIIIQKLKTNKIDTLKTYMGNNTWADGNNKIVIKNNEYREIEPLAYYILKKGK